MDVFELDLETVAFGAGVVEHVEVVALGEDESVAHQRVQQSAFAGIGLTENIYKSYFHEKTYSC